MTPQERKVMEQVLEALEIVYINQPSNQFAEVITVVKKALSGANNKQSSWPISGDSAQQIADKLCVSYEVVQLVAREVTAIKEALQSNEQVEPYCWTWDEWMTGGKWRAEYGWKKPERQVTNLQPLFAHPPVPTAQPQPAQKQEPSQDTLYLLRRLLSNQHTLTGPEFREELTKIVEDAYKAQPQQEPELGGVGVFYPTEQEPVAWLKIGGMKSMPALEKEAWLNTGREFDKQMVEDYTIPLYTHPPVPTAQPKEPEQEPVAWRHRETGQLENAAAFAAPYNWGDKSKWDALVYTTPPQRKPLTDEQAETIQKNSYVKTALLNYSVARNDRAAIALVKAIAAHGIKE